MKIVWVCILLLVFSPAVCQEKLFTIPDSVLKKFLADTVSLAQLTNNHSSQKTWTKIGHTAYGDVYAMPLDNMPCIIPGENPAQRMPNLGKSFKLNIDPGIYVVPGFKFLYTEKSKSRPDRLKVIPKKKSKPFKNKSE